MHIRFNEIDGFIRGHDGTRYLVLFESEKKNDLIYNRIRYLISVKSSITYIISHNYAKMKVDSYNSLPLHVIILIKSVWNKDKNNYCYIFRKSIKWIS